MNAQHLLDALIQPQLLLAILGIVERDDHWKEDYRIVLQKKQETWKPVLTGS